MANISQNVNIEMLEKLSDGTYKRKYPKTKASQVKLEDTAGNFVATDVEGAMNELFTNVSDGKQLVGNAITGVDDSVVIPTDPTFQDLATGIGQISTGKKWASGTTISSSKQKNFTWLNPTSGTYGDFYITISGIEFTPSYIVVKRTSDNTQMTVYDNGLEGGQIIQITNLTSSMYGVRYRIDSNVISGGAYYIPVGFNEISYTWIAFE